MAGNVFVYLEKPDDIRAVEPGSAEGCGKRHPLFRKVSHHCLHELHQVDSWWSGSAGAAQGTSGSSGAGVSGHDGSRGSRSQVAHFGGYVVRNWRIASDGS